MLFDMFIPGYFTRGMSIYLLFRMTAHGTAGNLHIIRTQNRKKDYDSPGRVTITLLNTAAL